MYLSKGEVGILLRLLESFFSIPYSNDLSGKDAETLIRLAKGVPDRPSKKKELFDIVDGEMGYSVKTLGKVPTAVRVDLQEQRFCEVEQVRELRAQGDKEPALQGELLLTYIHNRIREQMVRRKVKVARSLILLKHWDKARTNFAFRYWEEDFFGWIETLADRNRRGEIEWVVQSAGLHGRERLRQDENGKNVRLIRMHYKHNQIFTDHDIPNDAIAINFSVRRRSWDEIAELLLQAPALVPSRRVAQPRR